MRFLIDAQLPPGTRDMAGQARSLFTWLERFLQEMTKRLREGEKIIEVR